MSDRLDWMTLALLPGVGPRAARQLLLRGPLAESLRHPREHADLFPEAALARLETGQGRAAAEAELAAARRLGIQLVGLDSPEYPRLLREIYDPPALLWVLGSLPAGEAGPSLALVGTRGASPQGRELARSMSRDLAAAGATIVSGLARGIDAAVHAGALEAGGRTVAVLGSGLDRVYPPEHAGLAERIVGSGAVLSEVPLGTPPFPANFPRRNRIIAGLSRAVVVVEAPARSGALVTARLALDEGRDVHAVPGHPASPGSAGVNALIRDGAVLVRDARDVAEELGWPLEARAGSDPGDAILGLLEPHVPRSLDELRQRSGRTAPELLSGLTALELADRVRRLPGALFVRS